jgi:hypothetical protein
MNRPGFGRDLGLPRVGWSRVAWFHATGGVRSSNSTGLSMPSPRHPTTGTQRLFSGSSAPTARRATPIRKASQHATSHHPGQRQHPRKPKRNH